MMRCPILRRLLGGALIASLVGILASTTAARGEKEAKADPTKKPVAATRIASGPTRTAEQLARHIDAAILVGLKAEKTDPSPVCSDAEFVRRVHLDLAGKIPTAEQAIRFFDSEEPNKRAKLIDDLLSSKEFGKHQADIWTTLLLPVNSDNRRLVQYYPHSKTWLEEQFDAGTAWDEMVKSPMTVSGAIDKTSSIRWRGRSSATTRRGPPPPTGRPTTAPSRS